MEQSPTNPARLPGIPSDSGYPLGASLGWLVPDSCSAEPSLFCPLFTVHLCFKSHSTQIPPKTTSNPMNQKDMAVFYFATKVLFARNPVQKNSLF